MKDNNNNLLDRLDFIEFKQNLIFLKPPQHSAQIFYELNLDDFLKIRDLANKYKVKIESNDITSLPDFEKKLIDVWQPAKYYPLSASLIAKILMGKNLYNRLIS
ncbi:hypothetical protein [Terrisporobacter sp.]